MIIQLIANGMIIGCVYALAALGFALIYNTTRIFHFAYGAIYTLSAYIFYTLFKIYNIPFLLSFFITLIASALVGIIVDKLIYKPLEKHGATLLIQLLSSLALYIVIINIIAMIYGNETKLLSIDIQQPTIIGSIILSQNQIFSFIISLSTLLIAVIILRRFSIGRNIRAMRDDPELISAMGINPHNIRNIVFSLGSTLAAIAAILTGLDVGIDPYVGMVAIMNSIVAVIVGGVGIFEGAILGGLMLGIFQNLSVIHFSNKWQDAITFILLILFLIVRPAGILNKQRRSEEEPA